MEALSSLIRRADAGDPLAKVLAAILDSGLVMLTRGDASRWGHCWRSAMSAVTCTRGNCAIRAQKCGQLARGAARAQDGVRV
jgi:hypothetical protein